MPNVAVVTDTTNYLPREQLVAAGVGQVSLYVNEGPDRHTRESEMPDFDAFYQRLRTAKELPTTSQPSVGDFLAVYEPLAQEGRDIVSIHISAAISGTFASAQLAAQEVVQRFPGVRIETVDSRTSCATLGLVVLGAAACAGAGGSLEQVVERAQAGTASMKLWFAVETLEFLRRGGRIGAAQALVGSALKIKPILSCDGEIFPIERVRTSGRAFERMVDLMRTQQADGADAWVVQHVDAQERADALAERGREIFGSEPQCRNQVGPVIGTHVGPGLIGFGGFPSRFLDPTPETIA